MITNSNLIKVFLDRDNYLKYYKYVNKAWLSLEAETILKALEQYYEIDSAKQIALDDFYTWFHTVFAPDLPRSKQKEYAAIFKKLSIVPDEKIEIILSKMEQDLVKDKILRSLEEGVNKDYLLETLTSYNPKIDFTSEFEKDLVKVDLPSLIQNNERKEGLSWSLDCLNKGIGRIIKGDFIIIAGYVDSGKSCFVINEAVHMAKQMKDKKVLWLNNEEFNERVLKKILKSTLNKPWHYIAERHETAMKAYTQRMNGDPQRILFYDIFGWSINKVRRLCESVNPDLIVIDQVDKISLGKKSTSAEWVETGKVYEEVRSIAKSVAPVLGITQCDGSVRYFDKAENRIKFRTVIDMSALRGSRVEKQEEADAIITIGQDIDNPNSRYLTIAKNKFEGESAAWRMLRGYEVKFDGDLCHYTEIESEQEMIHE